MGKGFVDPAGGFDTIQARHTDVQDDDVGLEPSGFFKGFAAVGGFGTDLPTFPRFEQCAKSGADYGVIIRDEKAQIHGAHPEVLGPSGVYAREP